MRRLWYHREPGAVQAQKKPRPTLRSLLSIIGPGFITGAADDDPSGIATYSQTGAQFGFGQLWTAAYQVPLLLAVQECCGRIGAVTGKGLAGVIKEHYSRNVLLGVVLLVLAANIINIGADIGAVAAAARLVYPAPFWLFAVLTVAIVISLEIWVSYPAYANILKWLALTLLAYPATALLVSNDWAAILRATIVPHIEFSFAFLFIITGVFGTSISPYMFFWQASEEVEEEEAIAAREGKSGPPQLPPHFVRNMRIDTTVGMFSSQIVQWFIIVTTGTVLYAHGVKNINTAADAAAALEPLVHSFPNAGQLARDIFAFGVVGLGLLAIPILAGSAAYAMAEALDWNEGLSRKFGEARGFYGVILVATFVGLALNFVGIDPIKALVYTAVFNGISAVPLLYVIARINGRADILGAYRGGPLSRFFVWLAFGVMAIAGAALIYTTVHGG
ncbi:NRAMP family divalent metal transporter [uncultured Methylovirgula sp.]|uniref:NRAMP family divalent metal transporter n=1 Tax=uncultured Methylovirgula sp. TaxID=1285960 RepID=UPI00260ACA71|nr:divalent metal cation transporter [uncultured Methylovirgula sp.]